MFIMPNNAEKFVSNMDFQPILGGLSGGNAVVVVEVKCVNFKNVENKWSILKKPKFCFFR